MIATKYPVPGYDQATSLRAAARLRKATGTMLAVTSGKGGVGKSNVAVNLAIHLGARGMRVTLVDLDLGLANDDLIMNLHPRYTLAHVVAGDRSLEEVIVEGPAGISFIPGASGVETLADLTEFQRHRLIAQLQTLRINTDIVLLDCGAGISRNVIAFALAADDVFVVTTTQPTAMTDAYATIKSIYREDRSKRMKLVVNMAQSRAEAREAWVRVAHVARKFLEISVANGGYILHDTAVESAVRERCPFVLGSPDSNASACIAAMASDMARSVSVDKRRGGLLQRVAGLFL